MADDDRRPKIIACAHCGRKVEACRLGTVQPKLQVDGVVKNHHGRRRSSRSLAAAQVGVVAGCRCRRRRQAAATETQDGMNSAAGRPQQGRTRLHGKRQEAAPHAAQD